MANIDIIRRSKLWLAISATLTVAAIACIAIFGLRFGIDFTGGSLVSVDFVNDVVQEDVRATASALGYEPVVQQATDGSTLIRVRPMNEDEHQSMLTALRTAHGDLTELRFDSVGPVVGEQLKKQTTIAVILVLVLIAFYVAWAFRKVSEPVRSWKYAVVTLISALHDVIIPLGVFSVLGQILGYSVDTAFVAAILTILGYSINDTIVVFDRTRENLFRRRHNEEPFGETVNRSINETLGRSLNTTLTTMLPLLAIVIFGGESTRPFAITLLVGIISGAYSSIFLASPLLVLSEKWGKKE